MVNVSLTVYDSDGECGVRYKQQLSSVCMCTIYFSVYTTTLATILYGADSLIFTILSVRFMHMCRCCSMEMCMGMPLICSLCVYVHDHICRRNGFYNPY